MKFDWSEGALAEGLRLYDAGEFFTAHEAWESVWLGSPEPEKTFLQGLIQVTAAFHHLQRNNPLGAMLLLQAALKRDPGLAAGLNVHAGEITHEAVAKALGLKARPGT